MSQAQITVVEPNAPPWRAAREWLRLHPGLIAAAALVCLAAVSAALRVMLTRQVSSPFVFMDELGYERMAQSFAHTGRFSLFGHSGLAYSPLYPIVISPIYRLSSSAPDAYERVKALNAVLFSLSVLPIYGIARSVLTRGRAVGVCALSLLLPALLYANLEMSESLSYLLFLTTIWSMLRAIRRPCAQSDGFVLGAVVLASAARLQNVALLPAALTAIVLIPVARPAGESRLTSVTSAVRRHRLLYGFSAALLGFVLVKRAFNGGSLPLAGRYANVGTSHANPFHVLELAFQHLVELDLALAVVPFAGAIAACYALARLGFPSRQLIYGAVAVSVTAWLIAEVAYDAAAFDVGGSSYAAPRIHERYLIYLQPLFLIAFVAALRVVRPRVSWRAHAIVAVIAALLPGTIPFAHVVNFTVSIDSFGLEIFATAAHRGTGAVPHAAIIAVSVAGFFAVTYLYALIRPLPSFAVVMTVVGLMCISLIVQVKMHATTKGIDKKTPTRGAWVDGAAGRQPVTLVGGASRHSPTLLLNAFWNLSVTHVYSTCTDVFGAEFGERRLTVDRSGELRVGLTQVRASYVLAPTSLQVRGRVIERRPEQGLELIAPRKGVLSVQQPLVCQTR